MTGVVEGIPVLHAVVLGVIQGLTEFFPVSSSGHLVLARWLFAWNEVGATAVAKTLDVALHLGTFVGAAGYFRSDIARLAAGAASSLRARSVRGRDQRVVWLLAVSSLPSAALGALAEGWIEDALGAVWLVAVMLIAFALLLAVADRLPARRSEGSFGLADAAAMGLAQALALAPGVSRSGVTISAARWRGFERDGAARLSFLMSLPVIGGAGVYRALGIVGGGGLPAGTGGAFAAGMAASAVTGGIAVWGTMRIVRSRSFTPFVAYRIALGVTVLALLATGVR